MLEKVHDELVPVGQARFLCHPRDVAVYRCHRRFNLIRNLGDIPACSHQAQDRPFAEREMKQITPTKYLFPTCPQLNEQFVLLCAFVRISA